MIHNATPDFKVVGFNLRLVTYILQPAFNFCIFLATRIAVDRCRGSAPAWWNDSPQPPSNRFE
jgi:hypothetical protein